MFAFKKLLLRRFETTIIPIEDDCVIEKYFAETTETRINDPQSSNSHHLNEPQLKKSTSIRNAPVKLQNYGCEINHTIQYHINAYVSYSGCSCKYQKYAMRILADTEPKYFSQASKDKIWMSVMKNEPKALETKKTWYLTKLPPNKKHIGC